MLRFCALIFVVSVMANAAAGSQTSYVSSTLLEINKKVDSRPATWYWDTPVFWSETVSYELHIKLGGEQYWCVYTPEIQPGALPANWRPQAQIEVRIIKRRLFILRPSGGEVETVILRRTK